MHIAYNYGSIISSIPSCQHPLVITSLSLKKESKNPTLECFECNVLTQQVYSWLDDLRLVVPEILVEKASIKQCTRNGETQIWVCLAPKAKPCTMANTCHSGHVCARLTYSSTCLHSKQLTTLNINRGFIGSPLISNTQQGLHWISSN